MLTAFLDSENAYVTAWSHEILLILWENGIFGK
jgi:hypothetical protein